MATRRTDRNRGESGGNASAASLRNEVVEILAGAVVELFFRKGREPSPDGPLHSRLAVNSATSGQIRGSL